MLAVALFACSANDDVQPDRKPVAWIEVGAEMDGAAESGTLPGRIQAADRAVLSFEVGGTISRMDADIGESVGRGAVLAALDNADYRLQVAQASATLAETDARLKRARLDEERQESLFERGAASESRLEQARSEANSLASIASANRAQLGLAREALSDSSLRAPFGGRIARRLVEPGTQVSPGQPVYEIDGTRLEVAFSVNARQRERLDVGDTVTATLDDASGARSAATVTEISSRASGPGAFEVVARMAAADPQIRSGQVVDVSLPSGNGRDADAGGEQLFVPLTAIVPEGDNRGSVWRIEEETGAIESVPVILGSATEGVVEVVDGIEKGDMIVSRGAAFLSEDQLVERIGAGARRYAK
jgi:RND family efflux transporter MFP subunit